MEDSPSLRERRIAEQVERRFSTWNGDILFADVPSSVGEKYDVLIVDYESSELGVDLVDRINSEIPELLSEACEILDQNDKYEDDWGYQVNHVISITGSDFSGKLEGEVYYDDSKYLDMIEPIHETLFGTSLTESDYTLINSERWDGVIY